MSLLAEFSLRGRNPDVLTCIANRIGITHPLKNSVHGPRRLALE